MIRNKKKMNSKNITKTVTLYIDLSWIFILWFHEHESLPYFCDFSLYHRMLALIAIKIVLMHLGTWKLHNQKMWLKQKYIVNKYKHVWLHIIGVGHAKQKIQFLYFRLKIKRSVIFADLTIDDNQSPWKYKVQFW